MMETLTTRAWALGNKNAPQMSRRKMNGWFPGIEKDRQRVNRLNKLLGRVKNRKYEEARRLMRRWETEGQGCTGQNRKEHSHHRIGTDFENWYGLM